MVHSPTTPDTSHTIPGYVSLQDLSVPQPQLPRGYGMGLFTSPPPTTHHERRQHQQNQERVRAELARRVAEAAQRRK